MELLEALKIIERYGLEVRPASRSKTTRARVQAALQPQASRRASKGEELDELIAQDIEADLTYKQIIAKRGVSSHRIATVKRAYFE